MTNKPKTNKWVERLEGKLLDLSYKHDNEITMAIDDIVHLITQTQQETLEWCLKEVVGKDDRPEMQCSYPELGKLSIDMAMFKTAIERNQFRKQMRQTIKQRKEGKE